jgi:hypothetical protein
VNRDAVDSERIWRCSCGAGHFLSVRTWDDGDPPIFILEGTFQGSFRHRLRQAVRHVLRRGHSDSWLELCMDDAMVREIRDVLNSLLPKDAQITYASTNTSTTGAITTYRSQK